MFKQKEFVNKKYTIMANTSNLQQEANTNNAVTENGMPTHATSLDQCVDLFFNIGAMRGADKQDVVDEFTKAFNEDPLTAMKTLFWVRDVRGGAGERQIFRDIITYLADNHTDVMRKNVSIIPEYGRWDDVLSLLDTNLETDALHLVEKALITDKDALAAKWMPRPNTTKNETKKRWGNKVMKHLKMTPKEYRKMLKELTDVVETKMCNNEWENIEFDKVPSRAFSDYMKAFQNHTPEKFNTFIENVKKGDAKINAGAVYPYDVLKSYQKGADYEAVQGQWDSLPNFMENNNERVIPVIDTSGSMSVPKVSNNLTCMDVSVSLGLYVAERNEGIFKDTFINFHTNPVLHQLNGSISDKLKQIYSATWGGSTNLELVFDLILNQAKKNNVPEEEMPTMILIISDMQFDRATGYDGNAHEMMKNKYQKAGYKIPKVVFWNLNSRNGGSNFPVQFKEDGTALISGFSTSILESVLSGEDLNPLEVMRKTIESGRYDAVTV